MADRNVSNDPSEKSKAEGDCLESDSETVERYDQTVGEGRGGPMTRPDRSRLDDPTAERAADPVSERNRADEEDIVRRTAEERDYTRDAMNSRTMPIRRCLVKTRA